MKIYLTGSTGFVGQNLFSFYQSHNVRAHTRGQDAQRQCQDFNPDLIINCAAEIYKPELMFDSNILLTIQCLEYVKNHPCTKMIQIGSSSEYGTAKRATKEIDRINPVDMYQATKGAATVLAQGYARQYNLSIGIARPYSVYGPGEKPHRLFPRLIRAHVLQEPMILNQGYHDFIYIDDFVRGIDIMARCDLKTPGDIVNFGSGVQYSNFEIADIFQKITGNPGTIDRQMSFAKSFESQVWLCDTSYALNTYGFSTQFNIKQGIEKFLDLWDKI